MNAKAQKKKYHDIKKLFGKEYYKSYFINPKVNLSLSPYQNHNQSDTKKNGAISLQNNSNHLSAKINKNSHIIKIKNKISDKTKSNIKNDSSNKNMKKIKLLIDSIINKSNNNINKNIEFNVFSNYMSISHRQKGYCSKKNSEKIVNKTNFNYTEFVPNNNTRNIKHKKSDMNLRFNIKNKNILCDSLFKQDKDNKIKMNNNKNESKIIKNKNLFNEISLGENKNQYNKSISNENYKGYLNTVETKVFIKKIKIDKFNGSKNLHISKNKSYERIHKKISPIPKSKNFCSIKKKKNYILVKKANDCSSLYSKLFPSSQNLDFSQNYKKQNLLINDNLSNEINYEAKKNIGNKIYNYKNKSIDINNNKSLKNKFFFALREERKKLKEELIKKNIEEIQKKSNLRKQKYIELFNDINNYFNDIKNIIEKIKKEDLLKDITAKINDDMSYDSILNNENSMSFEYTLKSILNNGLFINKNTINNSNENNTSIINNDFTFEEDKKDISLKSINVKNNILKNKDIIPNIKDKIDKNNNNCSIF